MSEASTAVNKHLSQILAQIQSGDYDSAIENIGFAIGDDFEELIEAAWCKTADPARALRPTRLRWSMWCLRDGLFHVFAQLLRRSSGQVAPNWRSRK